MRTVMAVVVLSACGRIDIDELSLAAVDAPTGGDAGAADATTSTVAYATAVMSDGPLGYWRLNDSTSVAVDQTGRFNGTYSGNVTRSQPGATGDGDTAVRFNDTATSTHVSVPDAPALRLSGTKSLELWYNPNGNVGQGTWPNVISKGQLSTGFLRYYYPPGDSMSYRENTTTEVGAGGIALNATGWNHIVFVYDASNSSNTLYVNNVKFVMGTLNWGNNADTSALAVGTIRSASEGTTSSVDEVAVYNVALTAAQVDAHYRAAGR